VQANVQLYSMRNATHLGPDAVANFVRGEVAKALRSKRPYNVNLLLGGVDPITGKPSLYWCDYLAALAKLPYAAHGYAQYVDPTTQPSKRVRGDVSPSAMEHKEPTLTLTSQILLPLHPRQAPSPRY
jgi:hypothetical protein